MGLAKLFALVILVHVVRISGRWRLSAVLFAVVVVISGFFENPREPPFVRLVLLGFGFAVPFFFLLDRTRNPLVWGFIVLAGLLLAFFLL